MSSLRDLVSGIENVLVPLRSGTERLLGARLRTSDFPWLGISSRDFVHGGAIPVRCTADGDDASPDLRWHAVPAKATELILVCEDADSPTPKPFVHWVVYRIPPSLRELPTGLPATWAVVEGQGLKQRLNGRKRCAYDAPSPPPGHGVHRYHFQLFALREPYAGSAPPTRDDLVKVLHDNVVGFGETVGLYERAR